MSFENRLTNQYSTQTKTPCTKQAESQTPSKMKITSVTAAFIVLLTTAPETHGSGNDANVNSKRKLRGVATNDDSNDEIRALQFGQKLLDESNVLDGPENPDEQNSDEHGHRRLYCDYYCLHAGLPYYICCA